MSGKLNTFQEKPHDYRTNCFRGIVLFPHSFCPGALFVGSFMAGLILLLWTSLASAEMELAVGALTYHLINPQNASTAFKTRLSPDGALIANPIIGFRIVTRPRFSTYHAHTPFLGLNSLGRPMAGYVASAGSDTAYGRFGLVMGGYMQDNRQFYAHDIQPPSWIQSGGFGLVVLGGLEYYTTGKKFLHLLLTPALTCASIGYKL